MTPLHDYIQNVERTYILSALREAGTCVGAARALGVQRSTLTMKMSRYGIPTRRGLDAEDLPRATYRVRLRRWNGSWTQGTFALEDLPAQEVGRLCRIGEAELVMTQEPAG